MAKNPEKKEKGFFSRMFGGTNSLNIVDQKPGDELIDAEKTQILSVSFDQAIDPEFIGIAYASAFEIVDNKAKPLAGRFALGRDPNRLEFIVSNSFPFDSKLEIRLEKGVKSTSKATLKEEKVIKFQTGPKPEPIPIPPPPAATDYLNDPTFIPEERANHISIHFAPALIFDQIIDPATLVYGEQIKLLESKKQILVSASIRLSEDGMMVYISHSLPLKNSKKYKLELVGGENGIKSKEGKFLKQGINQTFITDNRKSNRSAKVAFKANSSHSSTQ